MYFSILWLLFKIGSYSRGGGPRKTGFYPLRGEGEGDGEGSKHEM